VYKANCLEKLFARGAAPKIDAEVNEKVLSRIFVAFAPGTSRTRIILFQIVKLAKFCLQILIHHRNALHSHANFDYFKDKQVRRKAVIPEKVSS
jgi:hypothetical protein